MHKDSRKNPRASKREAVRQYNLRQMDKYIKWSIETKGFLKWKDLVEQQEYFKVWEKS